MPDTETKAIKKLIIELPAELHRQFKLSSYQEGRTMKDIIVNLITYYVEDESNSEDNGKAKGKK